MTSLYPDAIDGYAQLPLAVDNVTRIDAITVNRLRSAISNVEVELGVLPSGTYETVRARLDALEGDLGGGGIGSGTGNSYLVLNMNGRVLDGIGFGGIGPIRSTDAKNWVNRTRLTWKGRAEKLEEIKMCKLNINHDSVKDWIK